MDSTKGANANITAASKRAKREPVNVDMLAMMLRTVINECNDAKLPVRIGVSKSGGLLLAVDSLTLRGGQIIVKPADAATLPATQRDEQVVEQNGS